MVQHIVWLQLGRKNASCNLLGFLFHYVYILFLFLFVLQSLPGVFFFFWSSLDMNYSSQNSQHWSCWLGNSGIWEGSQLAESFLKCFIFLCIFLIFPGLFFPPRWPHAIYIVCIVTLLANLLSFPTIFVSLSPYPGRYYRVKQYTSPSLVMYWLGRFLG